MITVPAAMEVMARQKRLIVPMGWVRKLNHAEPAWHEFRSALAFADDPTETPEGLMIVAQWKRRDGPKPENWTFGLFYGGARIYAIDVQPLAQHTNTAGQGRPLFRQRIRGNHEHVWSEEGYGYAEPIALAPADGPTAWGTFLHRAGIEAAPFVHPDRAINDGQQELGL